MDDEPDLSDPQARSRYFDQMLKEAMEKPGITVHYPRHQRKGKSWIKRMISWLRALL